MSTTTSTRNYPVTIDAKVLGKVIGQSAGYEPLDGFCTLFYEFTRNETGKQFLPDFPDGEDMAIDFDTGIVVSYSDGGQRRDFARKWSVFDNA